MKNWVVGILSLFENENLLFKVEGENEIEAMKNALICFHKKDHYMTEDEIELEKTQIPSDSIEEIKKYCYDGEIAISTPIEI